MDSILIIDTNAYFYFRNGTPNIIDAITKCHSITIPSIVIGEISYGIEKSKKKRHNLSQLMCFMDQHQVIVQPITTEVALNYGRINSSLQSKGKPTPENDIWIAAYDLHM